MRDAAASVRPFTLPLRHPIDMHRFSSTLSLMSCLALAACASAPDSTSTAQTEDCMQREPATGSLIVRREACVPVTEESRAEARRRAEAVRDQQERQRNSPKSSGS